MSAGSLPKYLEIAREIESGVSSGLGAEARLPSSREVARRHGVSPVTASRALQVLRDKGLIRTIDRSGSYITEPSSAGAAECWALVLRNTPGPWRQASVTFARSGFDAVARSEGVRFDAGHFAIDGDAPRAMLSSAGRPGPAWPPASAASSLCLRA